MNQTQNPPLSSRSVPPATTSAYTLDNETRGHLHRFRTDFSFYASRCLKIRPKTGGLAPLILNRVQRYLHEQAEAQKTRIGYVRLIILKGRQQGCSSYIEGRFYWLTSGRSGQFAYILTHEDRATKNLFSMAERFHTHCPPVVRPHRGPAKGFAMVFDALDSGYDVGTARTAGTGRSGTYQYFHGSEAAYWAHADDHMSGVGQAVPLMPGTEIFLESTASEIGNMFHKTWEAALEGKNDYLPIFIPWFWQDEYRLPLPEGFVLDAAETEYATTYDVGLEQMAWRRHKIANDFGADLALWQREYPATPEEAFQAGLTGAYIMPIEVAKAVNPDHEPEVQGAPKILGVDVAEYGENNTAFCKRRGRLVSPLEIHSKLGPMEVAGRVARLIDDWQPDAVMVDVTGIGSGVADRLIELNYDMIIRVHNGAKADDPIIYSKKRDEQWGRMRGWLRDLPCQLPDDKALHGEMCSPKYTYDSSRRLIIESKEHMQKQRGVKSPDRADALALTFAYAVHPRKPSQLGDGEGRYRRASWQTI